MEPKQKKTASSRNLDLKLTQQKNQHPPQRRQTPEKGQGGADRPGSGEERWVSGGDKSFREHRRQCHALHSLIQHPPHITPNELIRQIFCCSEEGAKSISARIFVVTKLLTTLTISNFNEVHQLMQPWGKKICFSPKLYCLKPYEPFWVVTLKFLWIHTYAWS
jgi:hypothetical protein